jgi:DNA 3'-phosphatase
MFRGKFASGLILTFVLALVSAAAPAGWAAELSARKFLAENFAVHGGKVKVAFFDADNTLRVSLSGGITANSPNDVLILPFVAPKIAELNREGYLVTVVSNQAGVANGRTSLETADGALKYMTDLIREDNSKAAIHFFDFAEAKDEYHKPKTGMARRLEAALAERDLKIDWRHSFMVGDAAYVKSDRRPDGSPGTHFANSDRLFAENLGIEFFEPTDFFGWRCHGIDVFHKAAEVRAYLREHRKPCE